ncbi:TetR/AcrR family transcriptional regulator [Gallaecimonas mangrovi]|uniref:TetR/AcrR family transcriptional regulator n=1 Tax=Gallaecimonas mangrovi TaxID=2291597 RepID=UPI000E1FE4C9|nr:TetR/AcrR family transcriptional regulator [Gallaecimonas mangrovi]
MSTDTESPATKLLASTEKLIYRGGIAATGMDAIVKDSGVSRRTLYKHFGNKDNLIAAALERRDIRWMAWFEENVARFHGPRARLLGAFAVLDSWFGHDDFNGCAFINTAGEVASHDDPVRQVAREHKTKLLKLLLCNCQQLAVKAPEPLAQQLLLLIDGAITQALIFNDTKAAERAQNIARLLLDTYCQESI